MSTLLVTYDLNTPGKDYADLLKKIKSYSWARLSESSYAISTTSDTQAVFNALKPFLDQNDYLYVITLGGPFRGFGPTVVNGWLENNLSY